MYVHFPLSRSYLQNIDRTKYLQSLTIIRVNGTLGKGLCLLGLNQEKKVDHELMWLGKKLMWAYRHEIGELFILFHCTPFCGSMQIVNVQS